MKKSTWILLGVFLIVIIIIVQTSPNHRLVVDNQSGQAIVDLQISVGGKTVKFRKIAASDSSSRSFTIDEESAFIISGSLEDGQALSGEFGYVSPGMDEQRAEFTIWPDGQIDFRQTDTRPRQDLIRPSPTP